MKARKTLFVLATLPMLTLVGCGETNISSSGEAGTGETSSNKPSAYPVDPNFEAFTTLTDLFGYLSGDGVLFEAENAATYTRNQKVYAQKMFQIEEITTTETGIAHNDKVATVEGKITTYKHGDPDGILPDTTATHGFQLMSSYDTASDTFYKVFDYEVGKEEDVAFREKYQAAHAGEYVIETGTNTVRTLINYYNTYLKPTVVSGFDSIEPKINDKEGTVTYRIEETKQQAQGGSSYQVAFGFDLVFAQSGALLSHGFQYLETDVTDPNLPVKLYALDDKVTLAYDEKTAYDGKFLNPLDYFMTDYEIGLTARNSYDPDITNVDPLKFPYGYEIVAETKVCIPEKALDTKLHIVSSSNEAVVKRVDYPNGSSAFFACGEGTTTLTVMSESKLQKTIEVTVDAPAMESIEIKAFSRVNFVGEKTDLYIFTHPDNTIDKYEVKALTPEIATLEKDDRGYYSGVNLKEGIAKFEVVSVVDPSIRAEVSYEITTRLDRQTVLDRFYTSTFTGTLPDESGTSDIKDAVTVQILDSSNATFTFNSDQLGHYFVKGQAYNVTYEINTTNVFQDFIEFWFSPIETVGPSGRKYIYDDIVARFYMNAKDYRFQIAAKDTADVTIPPLVFAGKLA